MKLTNIEEITKETLIEFGLNHFAKESYTDHIIKLGRFCSHGSNLSDCEELFEAFEDEFPDAYSNKDMLKALLMYWLPMRVKYIASEIVSELEYYKTIHRAAYFDEKKIRDIEVKSSCISVSELGLYWSTRPDTMPYSFSNNESNTGLVEVLLTSPFSPEHVNWYETFVSRIDYINGDHEQEFHLIEGAKMPVTIRK